MLGESGLVQINFNLHHAPHVVHSLEFIKKNCRQYFQALDLFFCQNMPVILKENNWRVIFQSLF